MGIPHIPAGVLPSQSWRQAANHLVKANFDCTGGSGTSGPCADPTCENPPSSDPLWYSAKSGPPRRPDSEGLRGTSAPAGDAARPPVGRHLRGGPLPTCQSLAPEAVVVAVESVDVDTPATLSYCVLALTIVGLPFARQCLKFARFTLWPFGRTVVKSPDASKLGILGNILWLLPGLLLALGYVITGLLMAVTIIGIPFALQSFKLIPLAVAPFGKAIVKVADVSDALTAARESTSASPSE